MNALTTQNGFALQPKSMDEAMNMANMLASSQMVPKNYQGKPSDTLVAMMMGSELGLNPIQSLQNIAVINGKPSIYGDALLALVQNHPAFGGIQESFDESTMTATCTVWRKNGEKHTKTFSQQDAQTANLWGKTGPWTQYPKRMLQMRARGFALRDQFADALAGLITVEEAYDMPAERDITPVQKMLNDSSVISQEQLEELTGLISGSKKLQEIITAAYEVKALDQLPAVKFEACRDRIVTFLEKQNANH